MNPQKNDYIGTHFVRLSVTFLVRAVTNLCIDGLPCNWVQMSSFRWCAVTLTLDHTSKLKVTQDI